MRTRHRYLGFIVVLAVALVLAPGFTRAARAASEDVAMFYDDLSQQGQWFEYENYGPVWHPNNVGEDWRPYTNGRWAPTNDGYVFETEEPWGWATYHYGNWMPTSGYGWVWVPGRTWYPSTVDWRTSPEDAPVDASYIGWAPTPPPNYVPPPAYAPPSYYPGSPTTDALSSPLWIFVQAASFLLGLGQPYTPAYSYYGCNCLAPPAYIPAFYPQTVIVRNYWTPTYYGAGVIGTGLIGAYNWGPPVRYVSRVTNINTTIINRTINYNSVNITRINNIRPPRQVLDRNPHIRQITPAALVQGQPLPRSRQATNLRLAQANLNKPNIVRAPRNVPPLRAEIPRVKPLPVERGRGLPGTALPPRATQKLTPQMERNIKQVPANRQFVPAGAPRPQLEHRPAGLRPAQVQPGAPGRPGQVQPGTFGRPGEVQPGAQGRPGEARQGRPGEGAPARGVQGRGEVPRRPAEAGPGAARPGEFHPGQARPGQARPGEVRTGTPSRTGAPLHPEAARGMSPQERQRLEQEHQRLQRGGQPGQAPGQAPGQQQRIQQQQQQRQQQQMQMQQRQREQQQQQMQQRQREQQLRQQQQQEQRRREQQSQQQRMQQMQRQREQQAQQQRQQQMQQQRVREQQAQQQRMQQQQQQRLQQQQQQRQQQLQQQQRLQQQQQQRQQQQQQQRQQQQQQKKKPQEEHSH